jgi:zinc transporter 2
LRKLKTASLLCFTFFLVEVIGGILAGSLAVLSDAAHLAADLSAFLVAIIGSHIASRPACASYTFGLKRTESLAALFSMVCLVILSLGLTVEATHRIYIIVYLGGDEPVDGKLMSSIAAIGVVVNLILAYVLGEDHAHGHDDHDDHDHAHHDEESHDHAHHNDHNHAHHDDHDHEHHDEESHDHGHTHHGEVAALLSKNGYRKDYSQLKLDEEAKLEAAKKRNVNLNAAYIHVLADLAQSAVVLLAGLIIWWKPTWQLADPICTLIFSVMVCYSTMGVIRSSLSVLLEEVPPGVDWNEIFDSISAVKGVSNVHDLHIWSISHGKITLSVHATADNVEQAFSDITKVCHEKKITHLTIQLQPAHMQDCVTCHNEMAHQCMDKRNDSSTSAPAKEDDHDHDHGQHE